MALFASCLLIMHMMLYFFHHFELPFVLNTFQIRSRIRNPNNSQNTVPLINDVVNELINQTQNAATSVAVRDEPVATVEEQQTDDLPDVVDEYEVELHISDIEQEMEEILNTELVL